MQDWAKTLISALAASIVAVLGGAIKHIWNRQKEQAARQEAVEEGLQALLHDRIFAIYAECRGKGYASLEDMRNLEYLYRPYHNLGGNGTGTEIYERVKAMPTEPPKKAG